MTRWLVVGGGTAGSVVAARLSEDDEHHVTVIEAGPDHGPEPVPDDVGPLPGDGTRWTAPAVVRRGRGQRTREGYVQGWGLGGSSLVNGAFVAPHEVPRDHVLPVEAPWADGPVGAALLASHPAAERGLLIRRDGRRVTAADAYLRPALDRPNLAVRTGRRVRRIVLEGRRATGAELVDGTVVEADHVVLCAGAIQTPTILLRSGVDTPGVGEGLQDHPSFTVPLALRSAAVDPSTPTIAVGAWHATHHVLAVNHLPGHPELGALIVGIHVTGSRGRVTLPDPAGEPLVELGQFDDADDLLRLSRAVADEVGVLEHPALRAVVDAAYADDRGTALTDVIGDESRLRTWIDEHAGGHHHVAGTCGDGRVTDGGAVRAYERLHVCDASAFRVLPRLNPYLEVVALAERWAGDPRRTAG